MDDRLGVLMWPMRFTVAVLVLDVATLPGCACPGLLAYDDILPADRRTEKVPTYNTLDVLIGG